MTRRGSIFLSTANEIGSALVTKLGGSGYSPKEWGKKANIMGIASADIPDALANLTPSAGGGDRGSIEITLANEIGAVLNKKFQTERGFKPKEWASAISKLTPLQVKTASGAIASFSDGADAVPLTSLIANIDPKQDLHGYSKPWAPGAGKNKIDMVGWFSAGYEYTNNGVTFKILADGGIKITGKSTSSTYSQLNITSYSTSPQTEQQLQVPAGNYTFSMSGIVDGIRLVTSGSGNNGFPYSEVTYTNQSRSGAVTDGTKPFNYILLRVYPTDNNLDVTVYPQCEPGLSATSYEPYSNVCPIEGSTETTTYQYGKNLFDKENPNEVDGYFTTTGFSTGNANAKTIYIPIVGGVTYTVSKTAGQRFQIATAEVIPSNNALFTSRQADNTNTSLTITAGVNDKYLWAWIFLEGTDTGTLAEMINSIQIELGSTATAFEAFKQKTPVTVSFGRTVYGGNVDVVSGAGKETHAKITFAGADAENWNFSTSGGNYRVFAPLPNAKTDTNTFISNIIAPAPSASDYPAIGTGWVNNNGRIVIGVDSSITSAADWKAYLSNNNMEIAYELADEYKPDFTFEGHEVESYLGANNIYNDTGDTSASYYADIDLDNA